jgi:hypothetical protein
LGLADGAAHRGRQYHGGHDSPDVRLEGVALHVEAKRVERLELYAALDQATADAPRDAVPVVWHRRNLRPSVVIVETARLVDLARVVLEAVKAAPPEPATTAADGPPSRGEPPQRGAASLAGPSPAHESAPSASNPTCVE